MPISDEHTLDRTFFDSEGFFRVDITDRNINTTLFSDAPALTSFLRNAETGMAEVYLFHSALFVVAPAIQKQIMSLCHGPEVLTVDGYDYLSFLTSIYFDTYEKMDLSYPDLATEEMHMPLIGNALNWGCRFHEPGELGRQIIRATRYSQLATLLSRYFGLPKSSS
jgi:hypothetical protein